eukprot:1156977-Pelagomonas_calceolata.AAC.6
MRFLAIATASKGYGIMSCTPPQAGAVQQPCCYTAAAPLLQAACAYNFTSQTIRTRARCTTTLPRWTFFASCGAGDGGLSGEPFRPVVVTNMLEKLVLESLANICDSAHGIIPYRATTWYH